MSRSAIRHPRALVCLARPPARGRRRGPGLGGPARRRAEAPPRVAARVRGRPRPRRGRRRALPGRGRPGDRRGPHRGRQARAGRGRRRAPRQRRQGQPGRDHRRDGAAALPGAAGLVGLAWSGSALEGSLRLRAPFPAGFPALAAGAVVAVGGRPCARSGPARPGADGSRPRPAGPAAEGGPGPGRAGGPGPARVPAPARSSCARSSASPVTASRLRAWTTSCRSWRPARKPRARAVTDGLDDRSGLAPVVERDRVDRPEAGRAGRLLLRAALIGLGRGVVGPLRRRLRLGRRRGGLLRRRLGPGPRGVGRPEPGAQAGDVEEARWSTSPLVAQAAAEHREQRRGRRHDIKNLAHGLPHPVRGSRTLVPVALQGRPERRPWRFFRRTAAGTATPASARPARSAGRPARRRPPPPAAGPAVSSARPRRRPASAIPGGARCATTGRGG